MTPDALVAEAGALPAAVEPSVVDDGQRLATATQWQLIWWRFRQHRLAMAGACVLGAMIVIALVPGFIAPYGVTTRTTEFISAPPTRVHVIDAEGTWHWPFVYGVTTARDPNTFRMVTEPDLAVRRPVMLLVTGEEYRLLGLIPTDRHLFGVKDGTIHLFGTDDLGRDVFSRTVYATQISLSIGLFGTLLGFAIGVVVGGVSGYFGGWVDFVTQRMIELVMSIPTLPFWLAAGALIPQNWTALQTYFTITTVLALFAWTGTARRVRSQILTQRGIDYVVAAELAGSSDWRIISRHLLPTVASYLIVDLTVAFPAMILGETALSFLGLGLRPPVVSWGVLMQEAQNLQAITQSPWLFLPVVFVILAVLAFNFVGDGLRDAADPYAMIGGGS